MFKSCTMNMMHFTLKEKEFNFVVTGLDVYQPMAKVPEDLARVKDKLLKTSKIDRVHKLMKCLLNDYDFNVVFSVLIANGMTNAINVPVDYYARCEKDPDVKPWISKC